MCARATLLRPGDGAACAVSTEVRRGKTRTRRPARPKRTSGKIGRQKPGGGKETHSRWKPDPEPTSRIHSCFPPREVAEDCPFPLQLMKSTFILRKEKAKGRQKICFLKGRAEGNPDSLFLKRLK